MYTRDDLSVVIPCSILNMFAKICQSSFEQVRDRAQHHDESKLSEAEIDGFTEYTPKHEIC